MKRSAKEPKTYLLPDGKHTLSIEEYHLAWRKVIEPLERALEGRIAAFDAHLMHFITKYGAGTAAMSTSVAVLLSKRLVKLEQKVESAQEEDL